jgi:hypothetical protein
VQPANTSHAPDASRLQQAGLQANVSEAAPLGASPIVRLPARMDKASDSLTILRMEPPSLSEALIMDQQSPRINQLFFARFSRTDVTLVVGPQA